MNPGFPVNLQHGYPPAAVLPSHTSTVPMPGVMPPLAYTHGLYTPVSPTFTTPGSLSASGPAPGGGGLLYEGNASPLIRPYGKGNPYVVPATHASYPSGINASPAHTQSAYSNSLSQTSAGTLYSAQSAYPPGVIPGLAPPTNLLQAQGQAQQQRQVYLPSTNQQALNPALGMNPAAAALAVRPSPVHAIPVSPGQNYQYAMMAAPPAAAAAAPGAIYPSPTYYPSYAPVPVYQNNGAIP